MEFGDFDIFAAKDEVAMQGRVLTLDPASVFPDPENVRSAISEGEIDALADTIRERGQLQPIIVAPADEEGRYKIQFGERRWRACDKLGVEVRAIVREVADPDQVQIDQFIENDQREQLSVRDTITFLERQVARGRTIAELARAIGRDRARLSRVYSLASAPAFIANRLDDLPVRGAAALMKACARDEQAVRSFVEAAPVGSLTVTACESFARGVGSSQSHGGAEDGAHHGPEVVDHVPSAQEGPVNRDNRKAPVDHDATPVPPSRFIEIGGRRGRLLEALVHFDGEDQARTVRFSA